MKMTTGKEKAAKTKTTTIGTAILTCLVQTVCRFILRSKRTRADAITGPGEAPLPLGSSNEGDVEEGNAEDDFKSKCKDSPKGDLQDNFKDKSTNNDINMSAKDSVNLRAVTDQPSLIGRAPSEDGDEFHDVDDDGAYHHPGGRTVMSTS